jgi:isoleucyl-tRNA synthetase
VKFPVVRAVEPTGARSDLLGAQVIIWTTTPWTLPSEPAVCFNPDLPTGFTRSPAARGMLGQRIGDRYLIADNLAEDVLGRARLTPDHVAASARCDGRGARHLTCAHPFRGARAGRRMGL